MTFQSAVVTLEIRSRSPKSNKLVQPSQQCIYASFVKIHPLVQKIMYRNEATWTPTGIHIKSICPPSLRLEDIKISDQAVQKSKRFEIRFSCVRTHTTQKQYLANKWQKLFYGNFWTVVRYQLSPSHANILLSLYF